MRGLEKVRDSRSFKWLVYALVIAIGGYGIVLALADGQAMISMYEGEEPNSEFIRVFVGFLLGMGLVGLAGIVRLLLPPKKRPFR